MLTSSYVSCKVLNVLIIMRAMFRKTSAGLCLGGTILILSSFSDVYCFLNFQLRFSCPTMSESHSTFGRKSVSFLKRGIERKKEKKVTFNRLFSFLVYNLKVALHVAESAGVFSLVLYSRLLTHCVLPGMQN